jgi:hypothetical protein
MNKSALPETHARIAVSNPIPLNACRSLLIVTSPIACVFHFYPNDGAGLSR